MYLAASSDARARTSALADDAPRSFTFHDVFREVARVRDGRRRLAERPEPKLVFVRAAEEIDALRATRVNRSQRETRQRALVEREPKRNHDAFAVGR